MPFLHAIGKGSSPYHRRTNAVPAPLHPRISGRNPRVHQRRYGDGRAMTGRIQGRKGSGTGRVLTRLMPGDGEATGQQADAAKRQENHYQRCTFHVSRDLMVNNSSLLGHSILSQNGSVGGMLRGLSVGLLLGSVPMYGKNGIFSRMFRPGWPRRWKGLG